MTTEYLPQNQLKTALSKALKSCFDLDIASGNLAIDHTKKEFDGDYTFVVFPYLRQLKKAPEVAASILGEYLKTDLSLLNEYNVVKGFLNMTLTDQVWNNLSISVMQDQFYGQHKIGENKKILIEYSSPNTNKPLHLGHVRNNLLGYSIGEILKWNGYEVIKANLVNDRGIHICKSMLAWQKTANGATPESTQIKGDHFVGEYYVTSDKIYKSEVNQLLEEGKTEEEAKKEAPFLLEAQNLLRKWEADDPETKQLWQTMNDWVMKGFKKTYTRMGVDFDKYYFESDTYLLGKDMVKEGLNSDVFYQKEDGSVWIDLSEENLDEKLLLRSDGTSVYMTQDMGTAQLKYEDYQMDQSVYVVGNEQEYHFKVLKSILQKMGKPYANGIYHFSYGMVDLPSGKMKTREGTVVDADELMDDMYQTALERTTELGKTEGLEESQKNELFETIGMGALKFFILKVDPVKRMLFNPEESIDFQGFTGPFIQYTHARICSILRNAQPNDEELTVKLEDEEKQVLRVIADFPAKTEEAARDFNPSVIAQYTYDVAKAYNRFYHAHSILGETDKNKRNQRLVITSICQKLIAKGMGLLGIMVPERM